MKYNNRRVYEEIGLNRETNTGSQEEEIEDEEDLGGTLREGMRDLQMTITSETKNPEINGRRKSHPRGIGNKDKPEGRIKSTTIHKKGTRKVLMTVDRLLNSDQEIDLHRLRFLTFLFSSLILILISVSF